jgi:hypothetical protein
VVRSKVFLFGASAVAMACMIAMRASAWGPHPEVDAARAHLVQALEEFDHGIADRSRLP